MKAIDAAGREWNPRITCFVFVEVERKTGLSFLEAGKAMQQMRMLPSFELAYAACAEECEDRKLSFNQFCAAFNSIAQVNALFSAVGVAMKLFSPSDEKAAKSADVDKAATGASKTSTK